MARELASAARPGSSTDSEPPQGWPLPVFMTSTARCGPLHMLCTLCALRAGKQRQQSRSWSDEEERLFLEALELHGRDWKKCAEHVGSRDHRLVGV